MNAAEPIQVKAWVPGRELAVLVDPEIHPGDRVLIGYDGMQQTWVDILAAAPLLAIFTTY